MSDPLPRPSYAEIKAMDEGEWRIYQTLRQDEIHAEVLSFGATQSALGEKVETIDRRCTRRGIVCKGIVGAVSAAVVALGAWLKVKVLGGTP